MRAKVDEIEGEDTEVLVAPTNTVVEEKLKSPRGGDPKEQIRKRCKTMYNAILNYTNEGKYISSKYFVKSELICELTVCCCQVKNPIEFFKLKYL